MYTISAGIVDDKGQFGVIEKTSSLDDLSKEINTIQNLIYKFPGSILLYIHISQS